MVKVAQVRVIRGTHQNIPLAGIYPVVREEGDRIVVQHPKFGALRMPRGMTTPVSTPKTLTYAELSKTIRRKFEILDKLTQGVIAGTIRAMVVSGAPGVGKTHSIERDLRAAAKAGSIRRFYCVKGTISPIGLYKTFWDYRHEGDVILMDDTDAVMNNEDMLNLCKHALDTGERRMLSYVKESQALKAEGIPTTFEFKGRVVFISNVDIEAAAEADTKLSKHISALIDRCTYLDLGMHDRQALMARVEQVCRETGMLSDKGLDTSQIEALIRWLKDNYVNVRKLSLRTAARLAELLLTEPNEWQEIAGETLLRSGRK